MSEKQTNKSRNSIQYSAISTWLENKKGTIVLPTGFGKTFVGCTIVGEQLKRGTISNALVVVPTQNLKEQWRKEFIKWGYNTEAIKLKCVQSAYKYANTHFDLIVVDEVHTTLSPQFRKLYEGITYNQLLGLTATPPKEYREILDKYCPVVFTTTVQEALEVEAIAEYKIYNVEVPLNHKDLFKYRLFTADFNKARKQLAILRKSIPVLKDLTVFDIASKYRDEKKIDFAASAETKGILVKNAKAFWQAMTMRRFTCYSASSKISVVLSILQKYPEKKWIIFNKTIKFAETLHSKIPNSLLYHSKLSSTEREEVLKEFESSNKVLVSVDALTAGLNVPDANAAITTAGVSTELVGIQQLGRIGRKQDSKIAIFYNLYCKDTVEEDWTESRTKSLNPSWVTVNHVLKK